MKSLTLRYLISICIFLIWLVFSGSFFISLGYAAFFLYCMGFIYSLSKIIDPRYIAIGFCFIQWFLAPHFKYAFFEQSSDDFSMAVDSSQYFSFAVPAVVLFWVGLFLVPIYHQEQKFQIIYNKLKSEPSNLTKNGQVLIIGSMVFAFLFSFTPGLSFFSYLIDNLKFVGLFYLLMSGQKLKYAFIVPVSLLFLVSIFRFAIFHELILWLSFAMLLIPFIYRVEFFNKLKILFAGAFFILFLQSIKSDFREYAWYGNESKSFGNLVIDRLQSPGKLIDNSNLEGLVIRFNQGWIISMVMDHVPEMEPFAKGKTIYEGFLSSFVPRIFFPDKPLSGGRDYFVQYTGYKPFGGTSMDLSTAGEGFANFGKIGGVIFMLCFGLLFGFFYRKIVKMAMIFPTLIFWIPVLFFQLVKAENDFTSGFNHFIKAAFVCFLYFQILKAVKLKAL